VGSVDELTDKVGRDTYQLTAKEQFEASLHGVLKFRQLRKVTTGVQLGDGWAEFEFQVQGGPEEASQLLAQMVENGIPIAAFERLDLALPDLLENILSGAVNG
jgi:hypothetical protein